MEYPNPILSIFGGIRRHFRRLWFIKYRKDYIKKSLSIRKGECKRCGCCAQMIPPCGHYDYAERKCRLWAELGFSAIPRICQIYPFDEEDKTPYSKKYCGYYWEK